jgi:hypothetical protein
MVQAIGILLACIALFLVPVVVFKSNAAILFLSVCAGLVLLGSLEPSIISTAGSIVPFEGENIFRLLVVILPAIFAAITFRGVVKNSLLPLHILLSLSSGFVLWVTLPEIITFTFFSDLRSFEPWNDASEFVTLSVALSLLLSLALLSLTKAGGSHHGKKHH